MKTKLFSLFVALCATMNVFADSFKFGDLYYNITSDSTAEVTYQYQWSEDNYAGLTSAVVPESVTYNGQTYRVTSIGQQAFCRCSNLLSITIPNSVTSIRRGAFWYCSGLVSVTIPNSVTDIGWVGFADCSGLVSIIIPNSVTNIDNEAFSGCSSLTSITIPSSVANIGAFPFSGCSSLTSITVEKGNTHYDSRDNCNAIIETATNTLICGCQNTTILNSVTSIGDHAFSGRSGLTSITIPNSVTYIGDGAFEYCIGLTSISIPNGVTSIGMYAFSECTSLTSIIIPGSITVIVPGAFSDCTGLLSITCYVKDPLLVTLYGLFDGLDVENVTLYVLDESVEKYKAADGWKDFKDILPISAKSVDVDEPVLDPEENKVTITWPATDNAATYTIEISKDGTLFCTLTFDANGVLKNMRFAAPSRHAAQRTAQAEATGSGFRFVVESLDYATTYTYTITATDAEDKVIESYTGTFTTTAPAGTEDIRSTLSQPETHKVFRDGQVYIIRGNKTYTLTGEEVK